MLGVGGGGSVDAGAVAGVARMSNAPGSWATVVAVGGAHRGLAQESALKRKRRGQPVGRYEERMAMRLVARGAWAPFRRWREVVKETVIAAAGVVAGGFGVVG